MNMEWNTCAFLDVQNTRSAVRVEQYVRFISSTIHYLNDFGTVSYIQYLPGT